MAEFFHDRRHVRLRSIADDGTYVHADEDGWGVSLSPHRASLNTAWVVHLLPDPDTGVTNILLHTAAYGRYLGVRVDYDDAPQPGQDHPAGDYHVVQCAYNTPLQDDVMWEAAVDANGGVVLRPVRHAEALVNIVMPCTVEEIPPRHAPPPLPNQIPNGVAAPVVLSRMIRYIRADNSGIFILTSRGTLQFIGRSLHNLIGDLVDPDRLNDNFNNITLCVRAGALGRLTPLVIDLPLSEETMDIVVLTTGSPAAMELRHPDVDAA